jgi:hypothetical protein
MKCNKCEREATHRVDGYAECGQDGGYVYQPYCTNHIMELRTLMNEFVALGGDELLVSSNEAVRSFTGLEYITGMTSCSS